MVTAPAAASTDFEAATWNLAMGNPDYNYGIPGTDAHYQDGWQVALFNVALFRPWVASFQEICKGQFTRIKDFLAPEPYGYTGVFKPGLVKTDNGDDVPKGHCPASPAADRHRGNAVFVLGQTSDEYKFDRELTPYNDSVDKEHRYLTCAVTVGTVTVFKACTLHASHKHPFPAVLHGIDAHDQVQSLGGWSVVGGDFNQVPGETVDVCGPCAPVSSSDVWKETHWEAAALDPGYLTIDGDINQKYDYIWSGKNGSVLRTKTGCTAMKNGDGQRVSDHRYCRGKFTFS